MAKPIIDMLVEATAVEVVDERTPFLEGSGYEAKGEFGIPGRRYFRKDDALGICEYHIHAFATSSGEIPRHLAFRDYLRSHPDVAQQYAQLKLKLSTQYSPDIQAYTDAKSSFIEGVECKALAEWRSA